MIILFSDHPSSPEYDETSWNLYSNGWLVVEGGLAGSRDIWSAGGAKHRYDQNKDWRTGNCKIFGRGSFENLAELGIDH
jgi:hypothetical protein